MSSTSNKKYTKKDKEKQYFHLTEQERFKIQKIYEEQLKNMEKINISEIAKKLGRHRSTIKRELKRNETLKVVKVSCPKDIYKVKKKHLYIYDYSEANKKADTRQRNKSYRNKKLLNNPKLKEYINKKLNEGKSPDIIAYYINSDDRFKVKVSTNTIYDGIRTGIFDIKAKDRKRMKIKTRRYKCKRNEVPKSKKERSIELRPEIINNREEFGHFEMDLVLGRKGENKSCLLTLTERLSRYEVIIILENKKAKTVVNAFKLIKKQLGKYSKKIFKSITTDNGTEFSGYEEIEKIIGNKTYFCHPRGFI